MALGFLRRHRRWLFVFLWIVILGFIAFYIPAFTGADLGGSADVIARVGDLTVSVPEFQRAYFAQRQRLDALYQGRLNEAMLRRMGLEGQVLEGLVIERIVQLEARRLGLSVDDEAVARAISQMPELNENGRFVGAQEYRRRLELQGRDVGDFEESVRRSLLRSRLESLLTDGVSITAGDAEREFRHRSEQVRAEYVLVDADRFRNEAAASDEDVRARFDARKEDYRISERRILSYALVDTQALEGRVAVTDRDLDAYYQEHRDEFRRDEEVCASHVLVKVKQGEAPEGHPDADARRIAQGLLDQIRGGADFAAVARKGSEDKGSADRGGDLPCFPRGRMVPPFENAAFSLDPGQTSDLVKSSFGYHVIRVTSRTEESVAPLAAVKDGIRRTVLAERVSDLAEQLAQAVSASLRGGSRLEDAAQEQGLAVQKSAPFPRGEPSEPLSSPGLAARAFQLKPGEAEAEPFPVPRGYAFIALAESQPARVPELKEVQDRVRADVVEEKALEKARALAAEVQARAGKAGLEKAASALGLVRKETPGLVGRGQPLGDLGAGAALEDLAYALPEKELSEPVRVTRGFAVLRVIEKKLFDPVAFEKEKGAIVASLREEKQTRFFQSYLGQMRERYRIERNAETFRRVVSR